MKTDKTTTPWNGRDTLGCVLVPLISASLGSWFIALWTRPHPLYSAHNSVSFGEAFAVSFPTLLAFFLVYRLTLFRCSSRCSERWAVRLRLPGILITIGAFFLLGLLVLSLRTSFYDSLPDLPGWSFAEIWNYDYIIFLPLIVAAGLILSYLVAFVLCAAVFANWRLAGHDPAAPASFSLRRQCAGALLLLFLAIVPWTAVAAFWKRGSDRAGCIMNIRNVQQGMRSYQGMNGHAPGELGGFSRASIVGPGNFVESEPVCPAGGSYTWVEGRIPLVGELMLRCSCKGHEPPEYSDW